MAGNLGFKVLLVADATATFDRQGPDGKKYKAEDIFSIHIASLHGEFCDVVSTSSLTTPKMDNSSCAPAQALAIDKHTLQLVQLSL